MPVYGSGKAGAASYDSFSKSMTKQGGGGKSARGRGRKGGKRKSGYQKMKKSNPGHMGY